MNENASKSDHSGVPYRVFYIYTLSSQVFYFSSECLRLRMAVSGLFPPVFQKAEKPHFFQEIGGCLN